MKANQKKENLQWQVGLFFTLGLGLTVFAIFLLGAKKGFFTEHYTLSCYFDDISGLRVGSPIRLAGIKVGTVSDISFEEVLVPENELEKPDPNQPARLKPVVKVKTRLQLDQSYQDRICTDSTASVVTEGLLGDRIIFLTVGCRKPISGYAAGEAPPAPLQNEQVITRVSEPKGFNALIEQGDGLIRDTQIFIRNTNALVLNLDKVVKGVTEGPGLANKLIYDKTAATSLDHLQEATQNLQSVTQKIDSGQGTVGALINDPSLYNDVKLLLGKANRNKLVRSVVRYTLKTKDKDHLK